MWSGWLLALLPMLSSSAASEGFQWAARPVVVPSGHAAFLSLDLHVPGKVSAFEYAIEVAAPDAPDFELSCEGAEPSLRGRWERDGQQPAREVRVPFRIPLMARTAEEGVHRVVLHTRIRTCNGRACADSRQMQVPVIVHVAPADTE